MGKADVGPAKLVGIDAKIVKKLAVAGAEKPALTDWPLVHRYQRQRRSPAGYCTEQVLREINQPNLGTARGYGPIVNQVNAG